MNPATLVVVWLLALSVLPYFIEPLRKRLYTPFPGLVAIRFKVKGEPHVDKSKTVRLALDGFIVVTVILMLIGYTYLINAVLPKAPSKSAAFVPLIPGVTIPLSFFLNLAWIIALAVAVHELFHYLACSWQGVRVRSAGVGLLFIFPIAFVEPDEEELMRAKPAVRARIYSAGPAANAILAVIAILLLKVSVAPGIYVVDVSPGSPAALAGIKPGDVILKVNGVPVQTLNELRKLIESNEVLRMTVLRHGKELTLTVYRDGHKLIGIFVLPWRPTSFLALLPPEQAVAAVQTLVWTQGINLGLGVVNALPMIITDGGKLLIELRRYKKLAALSDVIQILTVVMFVQAVFVSLSALR